MKQLKCNVYQLALRSRQSIYLLLLIYLLLPQVSQAATSADEIICKHCNILLLNIDFLRSDYVGPQSTKPLTPNIDDFFLGGMIFKNIYSPSGSTYRGNLAVFTNTNPFFYNLDVKTFETLRGKDEFKHWRNIYSSQPTLAEKMREAGYHTVMINKGARSGKSTMLDRGYTKYKQFPLRTLIEDQIDYLLETLETTSKPFFIHLHTIPTRLHRAFYPQNIQRIENEDIVYFPYKHKGEAYGYKVFRNHTASEQRQRQAEHTIYQQQLKYADDQLKRVFDYISTNMKNTVVILSSTHGTQIGDKGIFASNGVSYEPNIRVPLMIRIPGITFNKTIDARLSLLDLMPSIFKLLDFPESEDNTDNLLSVADNKSSYHRSFIAGHNDKDSYIIKDGWKLFLKYETTRSLYKLTKGKIAGDNIYESNRLISHLIETSVNQGFNLNMKQKTKKFFFNKKTIEIPQLYNLSIDPLEEIDLSSKHPIITSELLTLLQQYRGQAKYKIDNLNSGKKNTITGVTLE